MIADSSFIIDIMRNKNSAVLKLKDLASKGEPLLVTPLTIFELSSGVALCNRSEDEKKKILTITQKLPIAHLTTIAAELGGELDGSLKKKGNTLDPIDLLIGAIALSRNELVITKNVKDFQRIDGLRIEHY